MFCYLPQPLPKAKCFLAFVTFLKALGLGGKGSIGSLLIPTKSRVPCLGKGKCQYSIYVLVSTNHNQLLPPPLARSASIRLSSSAEGLSSGSVIQQASISWKKDMLLEQGVEDKLVPGIVGQRDLTLLAVSGLWPPSWPPPWWPRWRRGCRPG